MRVIGRQHAAFPDDPEGRKWAHLFLTELRHANWKRPHDIETQYPRVQMLSNRNFEFPIKDGANKIRFAVSFESSTVIVLEVI